VIIAEAAMARAHTSSYNKEEPFEAGTLAQKFRDGFRFGRKTAEECSWNTSRMPNPEHGCHGRDGKDGLE